MRDSTCFVDDVRFSYWVIPLVLLKQDFLIAVAPTDSHKLTVGNVNPRFSTR